MINFRKVSELSEVIAIDIFSEYISVR